MEVENDELMGHPEESLDSLNGFVERILFDKVMNEPKLFRSVVVITDTQVEISDERIMTG